jgi:DNA-binding transcriptional LysR family regulator
MSFGLRAVAPILPEFMQTYPEVLVDLHLSDALVDLVGEGFDAALRIGVLPDSALIARRLRPIRRFVVAAPAYLERRGRPTHPAQLAEHACFGYAYNQTADLWRFVNDRGEEATVRPEGPFRTTNGDAMMAPLLAGLGLAVLPEFIIEEALAEGRLETILTHWEIPSGALHLLTPPGGLRPARVSALSAFLIKKLAVGSQEVGTEP